MTWNQPPRMFFRLTLLLLTRCLRERHGGGIWGGIYLRAVVAQNHNDTSFKNVCIPQILPYIDIFLQCLPFKGFNIVLVPSTSRAMTEADISPLILGDLQHYLGLWLLISTCSGWEREGFWIVTPFDQEANPCPYRLVEFMSKCCFTAITRELRCTNTNPPPCVDKFWQI